MGTPVSNLGVLVTERSAWHEVARHFDSVFDLSDPRVACISRFAKKSMRTLRTSFKPGWTCLATEARLCVLFNITFDTTLLGASRGGLEYLPPTETTFA